LHQKLKYLTFSNEIISSFRIFKECPRHLLTRPKKHYQTTITSSH